VPISCERPRSRAGYDAAKLHAESLLNADVSNSYVFVTDEVDGFRAREGFRQREVSPSRLSPGTLLDEDEFRIAGAMLDHGTPWRGDRQPKTTS
jgi:hypothetical protein